MLRVYMTSRKFPLTVSADPRAVRTIIIEGQVGLAHARPNYISRCETVRDTSELTLERSANGEPSVLSGGGLV